MSRRPKRTTASTCVILNQLATPGLGSLMAGRRLEGLGQLLLALAGFGMILGWFVQLAIKTYRLVNDLPAQPQPYPWLGKTGALLFIVSWLWAGVTSLSLLRSARRQPAPPLIQPDSPG